MAEIGHTTGQLNVLFQALTIRMLGLWSSPPDYSKVRIDWPTKGQPGWKITEDIAFLRILEVDDEYNRQRDVRFEPKDLDDTNQKTIYTRVIEVNWIFYGPAAYENARKVRDFLFYQGFHDDLARENMYQITSHASPVRAPELFDAQWWERTDLKIRFNEIITRDLTVPYIKQVDVDIDNESGKAAEVHVIAAEPE